MEGRRYRYYELWSSRVRMIETGYMARMLMPELPVDEQWATALSEELQVPHFTISQWEALGRRLRRTLILAWNASQRFRIGKNQASFERQ